MNRIRIKGLIVYAFLVMPLLLGCGLAEKTPRAAIGEMNLSSWDFEKDGIVYLDGQWEVYWDRLLTPEDLNGKIPPKNNGYFQIPGYWNRSVVNGKPLSGDGYATFRLRVRLGQKRDALAVRIEEQATAYRLWVNGSPVISNGTPGTSPDTMKPYKRISTAVLPVECEYLDCVLQVSNFYAYNGGPYRKIALGSPDGINKRQARLFSVDLLLFGILGVIGIYHLIFYLLRRKDPSLMYFGLFCLFWCAGIPFGATGGKYITLLFPDMPWYWVCRMEFLTWFPTVPLFLMFFASLYPGEFSSRVSGLVQIIGSLFFCFVLLAPSRVVGITNIPYQLFSLGVAVYICLRLFNAIRHGEAGAGLMLFGFFFFVATVINDILFMNLVFYSIYLISAGVAVMILVQSFALARRFAQSFSAVETLTAELEEKNAALSKLDRLKDEFLANTSHELRTPLNGIIGIAESLKSGISGMPPFKTRENLSLILSSAKRLAGLINDILDFSRLKNSDIELHRKPVDMKALTDTVLMIMKPLAQGKLLSLHNNIQDSTPPVWGDEDRLQQILYNLIGNAIKFTDVGEVRVSAIQREDMVEISVSDTGIGISDDKQGVIFHPFEQADSSDSRAHGGAGLGLSITRQLVELHGGRVSLQSSPGAGAIFSFTIPVSSTGGPGPVRTNMPADEDNKENGTGLFSGAGESDEVLQGVDGDVTILAVDDDPINLQVVSNHLGFKNVRSVTASSGMEAVKFIEGGLRPDLILLDIMMPRMTGYDLLLWIRQRFTASELPIIMLTAKNGPEDLVEGFAGGANDYLVKPFVRDELLARVVSQLRLKRSYLTLRENMALRKELEERRRVERELRSLQQGLSFMLNTVDEALLAVNEDEEITFCNRVCEDLLGFSAEDLLGKPVMTIIQPGHGKGLQDDQRPDMGQYPMGHENNEPVTLSLRRADGGISDVQAYLSMFNMDEESIRILILRKREGGNDTGGAKNIEQSLGIIEAINRNRSRLQNIKSSLNGLLPVINEQNPGFMNELKAIDEALDNAVRSLFTDERYESKRHLAAEVMTCALEYWTESTGLTKAELAHQSRIWKVYANMDGWERTQTLDKYLQIDTFPQKPQWHKIFKTAEFVLANAGKHSALRTRLEVLLDRLRVSRQ